MLDSGPVLPLALLHLRWPLAVLLDRSRPGQRCQVLFASRRARLSLLADADAALLRRRGGCLTSQFDFARSEHDLRDGRHSLQLHTPERAPARTICIFTQIQKQSAEYRNSQQVIRGFV